MNEIENEENLLNSKCLAENSSSRYDNSRKKRPQMLIFHKYNMKIIFKTFMLIINELILILSPPYKCISLIYICQNIKINILE